MATPGEGLYPSEHRGRPGLHEPAEGSRPAHGDGAPQGGPATGCRGRGVESWGERTNPPGPQDRDRGGSWIGAGSDVLSHRAAPAVPSAQRGLTAVFGMGTGVSPALWPPATSSWCYQHNACNRLQANMGVERERGCHRLLQCIPRLPYRMCPDKPGAEEPVKPHGPLVRLGFTSRLASTYRLSTW